MSLRSSLLRSTALSTLGVLTLVAPGMATDLSWPASDPFATPALVNPAVSGPNFKLEPFGGWGSRPPPMTSGGSGGYGGSRPSDGGGGAGIWGVAGAFSTPIGQSWGLQIDGLGGQWGSNTFYGAAGHLFWRDPAVGLAGVYGSFKHLDTPTGSNLGQVAFEGEYYMPQATARAVIGGESLDAQTRVFTRLDLDWYATPDLALTVGYHYTGGESALALDGEWLMPKGVGGHRLSLFAEGRIGQNNHNSVLAGLKLYTGQAPTLIDKHRQDDPKIDKDLYAFANLLNPAATGEEDPCPGGEIIGEVCVQL